MTLPLDLPKSLFPARGPSSLVIDRWCVLSLWCRDLVKFFFRVLRFHHSWRLWQMDWDGRRSYGRWRLWLSSPVVQWTPPGREGLRTVGLWFTIDVAVADQNINTHTFIYIYIYIYSSYWNSERTLLWPTKNEPEHFYLRREWKIKSVLSKN